VAKNARDTEFVFFCYRWSCIELSQN